MDSNKYIYDMFENNFATGFGSTQMYCNCGVIYCTRDRESDIDDFKNDAIHWVDFSSRQISFEGRDYSDLCNCWHERAVKIHDFLISHHESVANYLNEWSDIRLAEAKSMIKVKEQPQ